MDVHDGIKDCIQRNHHELIYNPIKHDTNNVVKNWKTILPETSIVTSRSIQYKFDAKKSEERKKREK